MFLLPYQGLSSRLTLQRLEEVRPFEGVTPIPPTPARWGSQLLSAPALGLPGSGSSTLSFVYPSETHPSQPLGLVHLFWNLVPFSVISTKSQTLICHLCVTHTRSVCVCVCVCVRACACARACAYMQLRKLLTSADLEHQKLGRLREGPLGP